MTLDKKLRQLSPTALGTGRALAHRAAQLITGAARANLAAVDDDSHSSLGWEPGHGRFLSQPMAGNGGDCFAALSLSPLRLALLRGNEAIASLDLETVSVAEAGGWLDNRLEKAGLKGASDIILPYDLPADVSRIESFRNTGEGAALAVLSTWFDLAYMLLSRFARGKAGLRPGPGPLRCWPHHFDIATYVGLRDGDSETAKGIGVGMSPGDESYDQPYFYINPWPYPEPQGLPAPPVPGHWHIKGFTGAIATAGEALSLADIPTGLAAFIDRAFAIGRTGLGA